MIETPQVLASVVERAMQSQCVALDTEFVWERTYYPSLGVIQIALSAEETFLIDVPAIGDVSPIGKLLANPRVVKILHDAPQDLTILRQATGAFPLNIFDTRCAAGFVGLKSTISLQDLLRNLLGVHLPKTETRTDWLRRPLSEKQLEYASDDVRYLHATRETILSQVQDKGREGWLAEELAEYNDPKLYEEKDSQQQFRHVKGAGRLAARKLAILQKLTEWREDEARRQNHPRAHVVSDEVLINLTKQKPQFISQLKSVKGLSEREIQRYGAEVLKAIEKGLSINEKDCPQPPIRHEDGDSVNARIDFALAFMKGKSADSGIDPALVASRSEIRALVCKWPNAAPENHSLLRGWRREFLGEELLTLLSGQHSVRLDPKTGLPRLYRDV
ncbi:MAG: ribonuclease D [Chloroflexota bacterium]|nr:ribonuclease D [Chloroflexota bacterium]